MVEVTMTMTTMVMLKETVIPHEDRDESSNRGPKKLYLVWNSNQL